MRVKNWKWKINFFLNHDLRCETPTYWNGSYCVSKLTKGVACTLDAECDNTKGLICGGTCMYFNLLNNIIEIWYNYFFIC